MLTAYGMVLVCGDLIHLFLGDASSLVVASSSAIARGYIGEQLGWASMFDGAEWLVMHSII